MRLDDDDVYFYVRKDGVYVKYFDLWMKFEKTNPAEFFEKVLCYKIKWYQKLCIKYKLLLHNIHKIV